MFSWFVIQYFIRLFVLLVDICNNIFSIKICKCQAILITCIYSIGRVRLCIAIVGQDNVHFLLFYWGLDSEIFVVLYD